MPSVITIKRTDTGRKLSDSLTIDGAAVNLTGATVKLAMRNKLESAVVTRNASIVGDPTLGAVEYQFITGDVAVAGEFVIEWHVTLAGGGKLIFPSDAQHTLKIVEDLPE